MENRICILEEITELVNSLHSYMSENTDGPPVLSGRQARHTWKSYEKSSGNFSFRRSKGKQNMQASLLKYV
jgi:hypothetical protein